MVATTTYLSTDIAAVPLLWVIPLALYLLSFIVAFARSSPFSLRAISWATVVSSLLAPRLAHAHRAAADLGRRRRSTAANLFFVALLVHRRLAIERPPAERLTQFYLLLSAGRRVRWAVQRPARPGDLLDDRRVPDRDRPRAAPAAGLVAGRGPASDSYAETPTSCCRSRSSRSSSCAAKATPDGGRPARCCSPCSCSPPWRRSRSSRRARFALPWVWGRCS